MSELNVSVNITIYLSSFRYIDNNCNQNWLFIIIILCHLENLGKYKEMAVMQLKLIFIDLLCSFVGYYFLCVT